MKSVFVLHGTSASFIPFSLITVLSLVFILSPSVQCRSAPIPIDSSNLKSLFYEFLDQLDHDIENEDDIEILEDYGDNKEEIEEVPRENYWFRRDRKSMRCSFHSLCYCRSRMTGNMFCCDCAAGPCFPGNSVVTVEDAGQIPLKDLQIGQKVLAATTTGEAVYSRVVAFLDRRPRGQAEYIQLTSKEGPKISLSSTHLLFASSGNNSGLMQARFAASVQLGDILYSYKDSNSTSLVTVHGITRKVEEGAYVPLTEHGTIVVDHILASCYASFGHEASHFFLTPVRWFPNLFNSGTSQPTGVMKYVTIMKMMGRALSKIPGLVQSSQNEVEVLLIPNFVTKQP